MKGPSEDCGYQGPGRFYREIQYCVERGYCEVFLKE